MGPIFFWDNDHRVSGAEPEHVARYRDLLYAQIGVGYRKSRRNSHRACAYPAGINRWRTGASTPHGIPGSRQVIPSMRPRVTRYDHHKYETIQDPSVFPKPGAS